MKTTFKIFAQSPPCFRKHLVQELKSLGVDIISSDLNCIFHLFEQFNYSKKGLNEVAFRAEFPKLFEIMHYWLEIIFYLFFQNIIICFSRTVEVLKIEIGKPILARGEKELMFNLGKLPWFLFVSNIFLS